MAAKGSKGSIILEILIVLMALLLIAVILVPNTIWKEENQITKKCRNNINALYEAERFYYQKAGTYTDSMNKLLTVVQSDSGLNRRQTVVSLTNSLNKIIKNVLNVQSVQNISVISQATSEITQDLVGNERYFRIYPEITRRSEEIIRSMMRIDASIEYPNFSHTKVFIDSLRYLRESVSDYQLQVAILRAINAIDSLTLYYPKIEKEAFSRFWNTENDKLAKFISDIRATDISKVSTVPDRLKKFADQVNTNVQILKTTNYSRDQESLERERQNLTELHQKFLSPEFFSITTGFSLTKLDEIDSILISLTQDNLSCPDAKTVYLFDSTRRRLTIECPNNLDEFHVKFKAAVDPISNLPVYDHMNELDGIIQNTKSVLDENRLILRRYTDVLLKIKELLVEFDEINKVTFYDYVKKIYGFNQRVQKEKKLSVLKPVIEDVLNPMDTLATRIEKSNVSDLENRLNYYNEKLQEIDLAISAMRLPASVRNQVKSNADPFAPALDLTAKIKTGFVPASAENLKKSAKNLENTLLDALEGKREQVYVIFSKDHINHGNYVAGEKSWEKE